MTPAAASIGDDRERSPDSASPDAGRHARHTQVTGPAVETTSSRARAGSATASMANR
jgi:hypothetical protein